MKHCKNHTGIVILLFLLTTTLSFSQNKLPNILLFHADDMNWRDCEPYGNEDVITPNISRLANEGMTFDNMHTSTAMCSPTRQMLYTGLYPVRSGAWPNHTFVKEGVKSLVHYFNDINYRVALVGKVHHNPFESFPFEFLGGRHHDNGEGTDIHIDRIKPLLNQNENPFFIVVSSNQPHSPWNRGPVEMYDEKSFTIPPYMVDSRETRSLLKKYYAEITYSDSLLGKCIQYLEESGKKDNTIVIFTSEQGSSFPFAKWTCYDLGLKTSFIIKWPGTITPGSRNDVLTQYVDVVPTLLDAAGVDPKEINTGAGQQNGNTGFDGKSFLHVLKGVNQEIHNYVYGIHTTRGIYHGSVCYPVRSVRTKEYKYIVNLNNSSPFYNLVNYRSESLYSHWLEQTIDDPHMHNYVLRYTYRPKEELYNILDDPFELNNLAVEAQYTNLKKELRQALRTWMYDQGDKGIDTEMKALDRQIGRDEDSWKGYEEQRNKKLLYN